MPNASVPSTETITDRTVKVLAWHPNGVALSSHLSLEPRGQIFSEPKGANIGTSDGLGTQVEDYSMSINSQLPPARNRRSWYCADQVKAKAIMGAGGSCGLETLSPFRGLGTQGSTV